jgi:hypothetical protein
MSVVNEDNGCSSSGAGIRCNALAFQVPEADAVTIGALFPLTWSNATFAPETLEWRRLLTVGVLFRF